MVYRTDTNYLRNLPIDAFCKKLSQYFNEINAVHPFREGNVRTQRAFCDMVVMQAGFKLNWTKAIPATYLTASIAGFQYGDYEPMSKVLKEITFPLQQTQNIQLEHQLSAETKTLLQAYVNQQVQLANVMQQKIRYMTSDTVTADALSQHAKTLRQELIDTAKLILDANDIKLFLTQPLISSIQKQGGFTGIQTLFKDNHFSQESILTVVRYAKSQATSFSQQVTQSYNKSRSR